MTQKEKTKEELIEEIKLLQKRIAELEITDTGKYAEIKIKRLNRIYALISKINQIIVYSTDQQELLEKICRIFIEEGKFAMAWIGLVDEDTHMVKPAASCGLNAKEYLKDIQISVEDINIGRGPTGTSIREKRNFVCRDIEQEEYMAPWREKALKLGYRSSACFPLIIDGKGMGALNFYSTELIFFGETEEKEEIKLFSELAADISYALESLEKEKKRKQVEYKLLFERNKFKFILDAYPEGIYIVNKQHLIEYLNPVLEREFGPVQNRKCFEYFHNRKEPCPWCQNDKVFLGQTVRWEWTSFKTNKTYDLVDLPLIHEDGSISKLEFFHDITERKNMEKEVQKRLQELEIFYKASLGREEKIVELKKEIEKLKRELGK